MDAPALLLGILIGGILGALGVYFVMRERLAAARTEVTRQQLILEQERKGAQEKGERMRLEFEAMAAQALRANSESFLTLAKEAFGREQATARGELEKREQAVGQLVEPLAKSLEQVNAEIARMEKARAEAFGGLTEQLRSLAIAQEKLQSETGNLVQALRRPSVRGQWGEMQLRRVVEMAGMLDRVDFVEQDSTDGETGRLRPDMIVHLPGGTQVVVDAKTPLEAYLASLEAPDDAARQVQLESHARQVREHVRRLASKAYHDQYEMSPEFTVMFLPSESIFYAALEKDPTLIESGVDQKVLLATPTTLIALLRTVRYGWTQETLKESAREISALGRDLYERLATLTEHFDALGKRIAGSVDAYNKAVGTLEHRVLPAARRFPSLGVSSGKTLDPLVGLDSGVRSLQAPELSTEEAASDGEESDR